MSRDPLPQTGVLFQLVYTSLQSRGYFLEYDIQFVRNVSKYIFSKKSK